MQDERPEEALVPLQTLVLKGIRNSPCFLPSGKPIPEESPGDGGETAASFLRGLVGTYGFGFGVTGFAVSPSQAQNLEWPPGGLGGGRADPPCHARGRAEKNEETPQGQSFLIT